MKRPLEYLSEKNTMDTLLVLTSAFESIASTHLANIRSEVIKSNVFFEDLWNVYSKIRVDSEFHFGRQDKSKMIKKELFILVTAEGGFSGDVDQRILEFVQKIYDQTKNDILVIGRHGKTLLDQLGIKYIKFYELPGHDKNINVGPLIKDIQNYQLSSMFYSQYITLDNQKIRRIQLSAYVSELGNDVKTNLDVISEFNYIFEPSAYEVVSHLEESMLYVAVSQIILDAKLAQYASRFKSMSTARQATDATRTRVLSKYRHALRAIQDERLKETVNSMKIMGGGL
jgi:F-type H+-transporting ATPase subunit gamma